MTGYVQVYTGNGKGKTTAALGLCLRAAGAGLSVYVGQFMKKGRFSEIKALERFDDLITLRQFGRPGFTRGEPSDEEKALAADGLVQIREALTGGLYDLVVMEEINVSLHFGLVALPEVLAVLASRPPHVELILTGRYAPGEILEQADLVTEMREIKHYANAGVSARIGIEH